MAVCGHFGFSRRPCHSGAYATAGEVMGSSVVAIKATACCDRRTVLFTGGVVVVPLLTKLVPLSVGGVLPLAQG